MTKNLRANEIYQNDCPDLLELPYEKPEAPRNKPTDPLVIYSIF